MTKEVLALLKDRETARMAAMAAHEYKIGIVDQMDDQLTADYKAYMEQLQRIVCGSESKRERLRVTEIKDWAKREAEWV